VEAGAREKERAEMSMPTKSAGKVGAHAQLGAENCEGLVLHGRFSNHCKKKISLDKFTDIDRSLFFSPQTISDCLRVLQLLLALGIK
jgi:hypothetical protein